MALNTTHCFSIITILYLFWYCFKVIHRPKIYYSSNSLTRAIIERCSSFHQRYFPIFLFHSSYFQLFIAGLIGKIYPKLNPPNYVRELFTLSDGQKIALDWTFPQNFNNDHNDNPLVVALYGIAGDKTSLNVLRYCKLMCKRLNYASVVLGRRGHEQDIDLKVPRMSLFGLQKDIHECLLHIVDKYPNNCLILLGDSAGTGFWVRYGGDLALCLNEECAAKHNESNSRLKIREYPNAKRVHDRLLCSILISPGYDIKRTFANQNWFSQRLILSMLKQTFIKNHYRRLSESNKHIVAKCNESGQLLDFFQTYSSSFSGYESYSDFLLDTNPTETAEYAQIPALIINARDDPICTAASLDEWKWLFIEKDACPNAILIETKYGSHCAFLDIFGGFWLDDVILEYAKTMYEIRKQANDD